MRSDSVTSSLVSGSTKWVTKPSWFSTQVQAAAHPARMELNMHLRQAASLLYWSLALYRTSSLLISVRASLASSALGRQARFHQPGHSEMANLHARAEQQTFVQKLMSWFQSSTLVQPTPEILLTLTMYV